MAFLGNEIIQSRIWVDPNEPSPPSLDYKHAFPISVFDAIRESMADENSPTLTEVINQMKQDIIGKQPIIPAKPANYLVTYAGVAGAVGSIQISSHIPYDEASQSNDKIPTEKAVGELLRTFGFVNPDGTPSEDTGYKVTWDKIIGRPVIYQDLGDDESGLVSQAALKSIIELINQRIDEEIGNSSSGVDIALALHMADTDNPHEVTAKQIGAATEDMLNTHMEDHNNPHHVTAEQLGLGNVDNTADMDKPVSNAVQTLIDEINQRIDEINTSSPDGEGSGKPSGSIFVQLEYTQSTGRLNAVFSDGTKKGVTIPIDGLVNEAKFDEIEHVLIFTELGGKEIKVPLSSLLVKNQLTGSDHIVFVEDSSGKTSASIQKKSIGGESIKDNAITNNQLASNSVGVDQLQDNSVTGHAIKDGVVTSKKLAPKSVTEEQLSANSVTNEKLADQAVNTAKIANTSVTEEKIRDYAVTSDKLAGESVTEEKIANRAVTSEKVDFSIELEGNPTIRDDVVLSAKDNRIVTAKWVRELLASAGDEDDDSLIIGDRSITGKQLFSSSIKNRILAVLSVNGDPEWTQVNTEMLKDGVVATEKVADQAITSEKLAAGSVTKEKLAPASIAESMLEDGAVSLMKLATGETGNRVLAVLNNDTHPIYTKVLSDMIENDAIQSRHIANSSILSEKIAPAGESNVILGSDIKSQSPKWMKVNRQMLGDRIVDGSKLFTSEIGNVILAVVEGSYSPRYTKISSDFIQEKSITEESFGDKSVTSRAIADDAIHDYHIAPKSIGLEHLKDNFSLDNEFGIRPSNIPNRVMVTGERPADGIQWMQVTSEMIEDEAVTREKLYRPARDNLVLAATSPDTAPDYIQITGAYIKDHTLESDAFAPDLYFYGSPSIEVHPKTNSDDHTIADTHWVRELITKSMEGFLTGEDGVLNVDSILDHSITGEKLFTSDNGPAVLAIDAPNATAKYMKVIEEMIENAAVTSDKLAHDLHLFGNPTLDIRPEPQASDENNSGNKIVDAQWVRDRIKESTDGVIEYFESLLCCLKKHDDHVAQQGAEFNGIEEDTLVSMLDGEQDAKRAGAFTFCNNRVMPIAPSRIESIIEDHITPIITDTIVNNGSRMGRITEDRIKDLVDDVDDGEYVDLDTPEYGFIITPNDIYNNFGDSCCHSGCGSVCGTRDREFIVPILPHVVIQLASNEAAPVPNDDIYLDDNIIHPICDSKIKDIVDGTAEPIEISDPIDVDGDIFGAIPINRILEVVEGAEPNHTGSLEITRRPDEEPEQPNTDTGIHLTPGSVITEYLQDRSVTAAKLFTSPLPNMVLAVLDANSDPVYTKITREMIGEDQFTPDIIASSDEDYMVLGVHKAGTDVLYTKILKEMMAVESVGEEQLIDNSVSEKKLQDRSVGVSKLKQEPMIFNVHLHDDTVDTRNIMDGAVTRSKIASRSITGDKIDKETEIPAYTSIGEHADYERRCIRNVIMSPNTPRGGKNGDIWLRFY